jgi:hypothetical protein
MVLARPLTLLSAAAGFLALTAAGAFAGPGELVDAGTPVIRSELLDDLARIGVVIGPILLLGLIAALGWRLALATVAVAAISLTGAVAVLRLAGELDIVMPLELGLVPAGAVAVGLAIESSVLFAACYHRAAHSGRGPAADAAYEATVVGGGGALAAALGVAATLAALAVFDIDYLRAGAVAGAAAAVIAGLAAILVLPATISRWGWSVPGFAEWGFWQRSARLIGGTRGGAFAIALIVVATMLLQATPLGRAELTAAGSGFIDSLPLAAAIAAGASAVVLIAASRQAGLSVSLALAGILPAATATGIAVLLFQEGRLTEAFDYTPEGTLKLGAVALGVAVPAALAAGRSGALAVALRSERLSGSGTGIEGAQGLVGPGSAISTLLVAAAALALIASNLLAAKEFGFLAGAGLILDLVAVRVLIAPALARLTGPA